MSLTLAPLRGVPLIGLGEPLGGHLHAALARLEPAVAPGDLLVVAQKVVSKSEGRLVALETVVPGAAARDVARRVGKDPRLVELVLGESRRVVRAAPGVLIVETRTGLVCANAGIDFSNVPGDDVVALLPADPDASAAALSTELSARLGFDMPVVIADSHGRPWRLGTVGVAIGAAGVQAVDDYRGNADLYGRTLQATIVGRIDALAAAATLVMGEAAEGIPGVRVRGAVWTADPVGGAARARRDPLTDLFR
jgi:coenzyme F420-0:L-glutamate ligase/coenzyme F420-1:gamma-L-glutamate ligase